MTKVILPENYD